MKARNLFIAFVALSLVFLFGCFQDTVPRKDYQELEKAYADIIKEHAEMRGQVSNLTEERNRLYALSGNLSSLCEESEATIATYVSSNKEISEKMRAVGRSLAIHGFVLEKIFSVENPELQDVSDATGMVSTFNDGELEAKWQAYVSCGGCTDKNKRINEFQRTLVNKTKNEVSKAVLEIKIE